MQTTGLTHSAFFYRDTAEYVDTVVEFVNDGLADGACVLVVVPTANLDLLRDVLGDARSGVRMSDMADVGKNPANTFMTFAAALEAEPFDQAVRVVAEPVWPDRTAVAYPACVQNEALFNTAFADRNLVALCPYDAARLPADMIADARRTHPLVREGRREVPCPDFDWQQAWVDNNRPLSADPAAATYPIREAADLAGARSFVTAYVRSVDLSPERVGDLHLIVTELATNSLKYTRAGCTLALWVRDGHLVCEIRDGGRLDDLLAGRRPAPAHATDGRGLLLVNAMADLVRMHTCDTGTTIQVYLQVSELVS